MSSRNPREQEDLAAVALPIAGGCLVDLALQIRDDHRAFVHESVGDDVARALTGSRRANNEVVAIVIRAEDVAPDAAEYVTFLAKPLPAPKVARS